MRRPAAAALSARRPASAAQSGIRALPVSWDEMCATLAQWMLDHGGRTPHQKRQNPEGRYAKWVNNQRSAYASSRLAHSRRVRLESIPGWQWNANAWDDWDDAIDQLDEWLGDHNFQYPRRNSPNKLEDSLARWVNNQRLAYRTGSLPGTRITQLEQLWDWKWDAYAGGWDKLYADAEAWFYDDPFTRESPCTFYPSVQFTYVGGDPRTPEEVRQERALARWLAKQRTLHNAGNLASARAGRMSLLPRWSAFCQFSNLDHEEKWKAMMTSLIAWPKSKFNYHHTRVPFDTGRASPHEKQLAVWLKNNLAELKAAKAPPRRYHKKTKAPHVMSEHRIQRLEQFCKDRGISVRRVTHNPRATLARPAAASSAARAPNTLLLLNALQRVSCLDGTDVIAVPTSLADRVSINVSSVPDMPPEIRRGAKRGNIEIEVVHGDHHGDRLPSKVAKTSSGRSSCRTGS